MTSFHSWERRFGWLAFPGIIRFYALMHLLVFVLQIIRPDISEVLDFNRAKILSGEVWRIFTCFFAASEFGPVSPVGMVFLLCAVMFMFMVNDGLEAEWGAFKTSLFCYFGMLMILTANFILDSEVPYSGLMVYGSAFLAFATLYPKVIIRLMLILPVPVGLLGALQGAGILLICILNPSEFPFYLMATLNYVLWVGFPALRGKAREARSAQRRADFQAAAKQGTAFHSCEACGRTDHSHPELDFRIAGDGREFCSDHLPDT